MGRAFTRLARLAAWLTAALLLGLGGAALYAHHALTAPSPAQTTHALTVPKGATLKEVVRRLAEADQLRAPWIVEIYGRALGLGPRLKAGRYALEPGLTPLMILARLEAGPKVDTARVTIPEGFNRWQIADRLSALGLVDRAAFLDAVAAEDLEGRLFPDTYVFKRGVSLKALLRRLTRRHDQVWAGLVGAREIDAATRRRLLIIASLVEKEAQIERDRPLIAQVFFNRLARGMRLQTDPTCVYDEALYQEIPHPRFCRDPHSRYSTYVIEGLPPTPIANPGRAALAAALRPAEGEAAARLLYFVAKRDGSRGHAFNETYEAHKADVKRYLMQPKVK
ncbi:endolytic transglycosylase MltG [Myxococcota bacterium]|nr:endolytic transglycosylase MltG [Myxococcota bacterium]MBU1431100.1 endolytic transglycosylase MltG [Myxococcota bacterium]MBU1899895.1 endolytic transglycosylase MltG [Myxococcota bacterium]